MKKSILLIIIIFFGLVPVLVNAKEYCKVVSGNGKDIGSEIACGTEHFYLFDNVNSNIRLLSKYNLLAGISFDHIIVDGNVSNYQDLNEAIELMNQGYYYNGREYDSETDKTEFRFVKDNDLIPNIVRQNEKAIGAHGQIRGKAELPEYGSFYATSLYGNIDTSHIYDNDFYQDYLLSDTLNDGIIKKTLNKYNAYYSENDITIQNLDLLTIKDIDDFTYKVANQRLPLNEWTTNWTVGQHFYSNYNIVGSLKDCIPDQYSWIWSTTYWTRTAYNDVNHPYFYFVDTWGDICNGDFCYVDVGAGLRPSITISKSDLLYIINSITDGNGSIDVIKSSLGGENIQFKVTSKKGYKLNKIIVTTDSGEKVEFTEGEIVNNSDGTVSIDKNRFTMPFENVTIEAKWKSDSIINPETGGKVLFIILIIITNIGIGTRLYKKKESRYKI